MTSERARRARRRRRRVDLAISPGGRPADDSPVGTPGGRQNWVDKAGGLPTYIREIAHALLRKGRTESDAIRLAVAAVRNFAAGHDGRGHKVSAKVQAAAAAALAEWEAKKAGSHAKNLSNGADMSVDLSVFDPAKHPRGAKGNPNGGKFVPVGKARDQQAAQAQQSRSGRTTYGHEIVASKQVQSARLARLSDAQLQALSREAYSFKSSNPNVVKLRIAVANEMASRGFDVKDFGALGGGINSNKGVAAARARAKAVGSSTTTAAEHFTARHGTPAEKARALKRLKAKAHNMANEQTGDAVDLATLTAKQRKKLKPSQFAVGSDQYPIPDAVHARNALARVAQFGTAAEQAAVRRAVKRKFPNIGKKAAS